MTPVVYSSLDAQIALVTGANRGIGKAIAAGLADAGASVYAGARTPSEVKDETVTPIELDLTEERTLEDAISTIEERDSELHILVNNAGIGGPRGQLHQSRISEIDETFRVNLRGPILLSRLALPMLLENDGSRIVNVSSGMGALNEGMSGSYPAYRISKAGLNALTVYLHGEYGDAGLLANSACPGWVQTDLGSPNAPKTPAEGADTPIWLAKFKPGSTAGRFWRNREIIEW